MKNNYCVYKHTNKINGKVYIGITCQDVEKRWDWGFGYYQQPIFFNAIKKYGWKGFTHEILFTGLTKEEACEKEIELIAKYKSNRKRYNNPSYGYNATDGGDACGWDNSKSIAQYDLEGNLLKVWDSIKEASDATGVAYQTIQTTLSGRTGRAGKFMWYYVDKESGIEEKVESYNEKMKIKKYIKEYAPENYNWVAVAQYDLEGNLIKVWDSIKQASEGVGGDSGGISSALEKRPTAYGYIWRRVDGVPEEKIKPVLSKQKKAVSQYDLDGNYIATYESASEAGRQTKINNSHICGCAKGNRTHAGGYIWRYEI